MALETLLGIKTIGEFELYDCTESDEGLEAAFVCVDHSVNAVGFRIQNGPIKEVGVNGCQVDTMIETAKIIIEGLNAKFPCRENSIAITKLEEALMWMEQRRKNREKRGVEGTSRA